jgi:hypothetical protein
MPAVGYKALGCHNLATALLCVAAVAGFSGIAAPAGAQTRATPPSCSVTGTVSDTTGAALPGVIVALATPLYGAGAVGGVVNVISREPSRNALTGEVRMESRQGLPAVQFNGGASWIARDRQTSLRP